MKKIKFSIIISILIILTIYFLTQIKIKYGNNIKQINKKTNKNNYEQERSSLLVTIENKIKEKEKERKNKVEYLTKVNVPDHKDYLNNQITNLTINLSKFTDIPELKEYTETVFYDIFPNESLKYQDLVKTEMNIENTISNWENFEKKTKYMSFKKIKEKYTTKQDFLLSPRNLILSPVNLETSDSDTSEHKKEIYRLDLYIFPQYENIPILEGAKSKIILLSNLPDSNKFIPLIASLHETKPLIKKRKPIKRIQTAPKKEILERIKNGMIYILKVDKAWERDSLFFNYETRNYPNLESENDKLNFLIKIFDARLVHINHEELLLLRSELYLNDQFYSWLPLLVDITNWGSENLTY